MQRPVSGLASDLGEYAEAKRLCRKSLALLREIGDRYVMALCLNNLGHAACGLGEFRESERHFREALITSTDMHAVPLTLYVLVEMTTLLIKQGATEEAVELLAFALGHPASVKATREKAQDLLAELTSRLPRKITAAAKERGKARRLEDIVDGILRET
ncbi:MAG: hypothetical protein A2Z21_04015 [Candidatus Fraserbacteria bacterium RBG_16_55_9]|uniref:MalT-like TPR region domain-containing protein n=1 Tax=Fraserbacteria sp. (strain RBG_16_55_9) TaxID=1817864 RepID=A0A1F5V2Q8_FRAXR|nr:MAG: hypothetical protein A2Z21_04015 [Candidatus Fraserbacteria bacterium RBG_16_55_9]